MTSPAFEVQRRQLVAQRLARAGPHDGERVMPLQHVANDLMLAGRSLFSPNTSCRVLRIAFRRFVMSAVIAIGA
jgi:hypothetical protein